MSKHITGDEMKRYFEIIHAGALQEGDADFVDEIDAHVAECDSCFEKMQTVRLLMRGIASDRELAEAYLRAEFPEPLCRPAFDIRKAFAGIRIVKEELEGRIQMLADTISGRMDAVFSPVRPALAAVRGDQDIPPGGALNDLLLSDMSLPLAEGRKITLRCRRGDSSGGIRLFVYSNFEAPFILRANGEPLDSVQSGYDTVTREYVWVYELQDDEFELTVE